MSTSISRNYLLTCGFPVIVVQVNNGVHGTGRCAVWWCAAAVCTEASENSLPPFLSSAMLVAMKNVDDG